MTEQWIAEIATFPDVLENELSAFSDALLETSYRPGGWTGRQVVHHLMDSHINSYVRFKLTLTEDSPVIKPYLEAQWAQLPDYEQISVKDACSLLRLIHQRWVVILKSMTDDQFRRKYIHPEYQKEFSLHEALGMYAWHCRHHLGHLKLIRKS